jgi:HlyD family secretion protein/adhesin transport system membrane fusion protein
MSVSAAGNSAPSPVIAVQRKRRSLAAGLGDDDRIATGLVHAGVLMSLVTVVGFFAWAAVAPVNEVAATTGEVVPAGQVQNVQHLEGGLIAEIYVNEGQLIDGGQPVLRFDSAQAEAERARLLARLLALRVQAERQRAFAESETPRWDAFSDVEPAVIYDQQRLYAAQIDARRTQIAVIEQQIATKNAEIVSMRQTRETLQNQIALLSEERDIREDLFRRELNSRLTLLSARMQLNSAQTEVRRLNTTIENSAQEIVELRNRINDVEAQLRKEALDRLNQARSEMVEVQKTLSGLDDRVQRLTVLSPVRGLVQQIPVKTPGGVVAPGGLVAQVVPVDDELIVEAKVSARDIGFVQAGQIARVKIGAYDFTRFGIIEGKVQSISASTFLDEQKNPYYKARIRVDKPYVGDDPTKRPLLPGMTAQADIATGQKTVLQYLLKPIYATIDSAFRER